MMKSLLTLITFSIVNQGIRPHLLYKVMMDNFYDIVEEAELYFSIHPKRKESGWKGFQRWQYINGQIKNIETIKI